MDETENDDASRSPSAHSEVSDNDELLRQHIPPERIFIRGLAMDTAIIEIVKYFDKYVGFNPGEITGRGIVVRFADPSAVDDVMMNGTTHVINDKLVEIKRAMLPLGDDVDSTDSGDAVIECDLSGRFASEEAPAVPPPADWMNNLPRFPVEIMKNEPWKPDPSHPLYKLYTNKRGCQYNSLDKYIQIFNNTVEKYVNYFGTYGVITDHAIVIRFCDPSVVDEVMKGTPHVINGKQVEIKRAVLPRGNVGSADFRTNKISVDHTDTCNANAVIEDDLSEKAYDDLQPTESKIPFTGVPVETGKAEPEKPNLPLPSSGRHKNESGSSYNSYNQNPKNQF